MQYWFRSLDGEDTSTPYWNMDSQAVKKILKSSGGGEVNIKLDFTLQQQKMVKKKLCIDKG